MRTFTLIDGVCEAWLTLPQTNYNHIFCLTNGFEALETRKGRDIILCAMLHVWINVKILNTNRSGEYISMTSSAPEGNPWRDILKKKPQCGDVSSSENGARGNHVYAWMLFKPTVLILSNRSWPIFLLLEPLLNWVTWAWLNHCLPFPDCYVSQCYNGGTCKEAVYSSQYVCQCPLGFSGAHCEISKFSCDFCCWRP